MEDGGERGRGGEHIIFSEAACVDQDCCAGYSHTACPSPECISPNLSFLQDFSCKFLPELTFSHFCSNENRNF